MDIGSIPVILTASPSHYLYFYGCRFRSAFASWFDKGLFVSFRTNNFWGITEFDVAFSLAQQFKDEDDNVDDDVIEMGQDAKKEPEPRF